MCSILGLKTVRIKYKMTQLSIMAVFQHCCVIAAGEEKYIDGPDRQKKALRNQEKLITSE